MGDARVYVSGGAEHQGPEGGGPVCVIFDVELASDARALVSPADGTAGDLQLNPLNR